MRVTTEAGAKLSTPAKVAISRKCKVQTNPAEKKRNVRGTADPNVSAWDRLNQLKGKHLTVMSGKLRCDACKETVCKKKSSVSKHIASQKHIKSKEVIAKSKKKDQSIVDLMKRNDEQMNPKGSTLPKDMRLYRYELVESLLTTGIPISKVDNLRPFLEKYGHRLTSSSHLTELIHLILKREKDCVKSEIATTDSFSVIFDGSTRLGEALPIVVRFIDNQ